MDKKEDLKFILPHKAPMILIDEIIEYSLDEKWLKSKVTIKKDSMFFDSQINGVSSIVGIEYMAQTIGCYAFKKGGYEEPRIGFLLGSRLYNNLLEKFELGETYHIIVKEIFSGDDIVSFECIIYDKNNEEVASSTINAYQGEEIEKGLLKNG